MSLPRIIQPQSFKTVLRPIRLKQCLLARHASTNEPSSKTRPLVLEQPDKFRPPSHGARRPRRSRSYGPSLTEEEIKEQGRRKYPHMMPPEGTVMYKFLTSKGIHVWISMGILVSLTGFVILTDFKTKNKFPELLPSGSLFFSNPISYIQQYLAVYKLHSQAYMQEQQEKRAKMLDEARKRKEYLIKHGIEKEGLFGFGTVEGDLRKEKRAKEAEEARARDEEGGDEVTSKAESITESAREGALNLSQTTFAGQVQETAQKAKKWFGNW